MKTGRCLQELEAELERQRKYKKDYWVDTARMAMEVVAPEASSPYVRLRLAEHGRFHLTRHSRQQLCKLVEMPAKYYNRMLKAAPKLLAQNVNFWLKAEPKRMFVRTLDGKVRGVLSDRYLVLDNWDIAKTVLPALKEAEAQVVSCELTETHLYLKAVVPDKDARVELWPKGVEAKWGQGSHDVHVLQPGVVVSNSEVGGGALTLWPATHTVHCSNLAMWHSLSDSRAPGVWRKLHQGPPKQGDGTRHLSDAAVWDQVRNLVHEALQGERFGEFVAEVKKSLGHKIEGDPEEAVEVLATQHHFTKHERRLLLHHLNEGGHLSQYGLHQAVTRLSQDVASYDRAGELERLGARIVQLEGEDWAKIALAGAEGGP